MIISKTPFRISFFGGGTDYPVWYKKYGGATLSTTIDKYSYITSLYYPPYFPSKHRVVWSKIELVNASEEILHPSVRETLKYLNFTDGVEIHNSSDLPARSGIGSSSAFTVGLLNALYALRGEFKEKKDLALEAIHIEQNLIKENVGSQDQIAVAVGGLNKTIFSPNGDIEIEPVEMAEEREKVLNDRFMLFFTGFQRTASEVAAEWIKNVPKKEKELLVMRGMVDRAVDILTNEKSNIDDFGLLLNDAWQIKRNLNHVVTTNEIDEIYRKAQAAGALGGKLLGAGQGGFMLLYVDPEHQPKVKDALKDLIYVPFRFEKFGTQIIQNGDGSKD